MAEKGADAKNGPRLRPIASIDALLSWEPGSRPDDVFCRASVPLRVEEGAEDVRHCFLKNLESLEIDALARENPLGLTNTSTPFETQKKAPLLVQERGHPKNRFKI